MATQVTVKSKTTGTLTFYTSYANARSAAAAGDVIQIRADLDEQIILKDGVDIIITSGKIVDIKASLPTIIDNGVKCICNIFGGGIIKNSNTGTVKQECIKISNALSEIYIQCDSIYGLGGSSSGTRNLPAINVTQAAKFSVVCNNIYSNVNTSVLISNCSDFYIKCKSIESGTFGSIILYIMVVRRIL